MTADAEIGFQQLRGTCAKDAKEDASMDERRHKLGLACTTSAALTFAVVAALAKSAALPPLLMLQIRSMVQWAASVLSLYIRHSNSNLPVVDQLIGPAPLRGWLMLRAALYWCFQAAWWSALQMMPLGDATSIVYSAPIFTGFFAFCFLSERIDANFCICVCLACSGVTLIVKPSLLFGGAVLADDSYFFGAAFAMASALSAGLLPVAVRKSPDVHWTTIENVTAAVACVGLTPAAIASWQYFDSTAAEAIDASLRAPTGWCIVAIAAIVEFGGLALQTVGYQMVRHTATASIMNYIEVPFAFLLQAVFFAPSKNGPPFGSVALGSGLVLSAGLVNLQGGLCRQT